MSYFQLDTLGSRMLSEYQTHHPQYWLFGSVAADAYSVSVSLGLGTSRTTSSARFGSLLDHS